MENHILNMNAFYIFIDIIKNIYYLILFIKADAFSYYVILFFLIILLPLLGYKLACFIMRDKRDPLTRDMQNCIGKAIRIFDGHTGWDRKLSSEEEKNMKAEVQQKIVDSFSEVFRKRAKNKLIQILKS